MSRVTITREQYDSLFEGLNDFLQRWIVEDTFEFEHLGQTFAGLTSRINVGLYGFLETMFHNWFDTRYPRIQRLLVTNTAVSLDSAIVGLFSVREKGSFTPDEIKTYLLNHAKHLFSDDRYPTFIGNHISVQE